MNIRRYVKSALKRFTKNTAFRRAFAIAVGIKVEPQPEVIVVMKPSPYKDIIDCFENQESPMDGRS